MIIDMHTHIGCALDFHMKEETLWHAMQKYHIDFALCSNCEAAEFDHNLNPIPTKEQKSQEEAYMSAIKFAEKHPKHIGVLPWVKPKTQGVTQELVTCIEQHRNVTYGIKLHPYHSNTSFNSPKTEVFIQLAEDLSLPVLTHTGNSSTDNCKQVYAMAKKHPHVPFIMAHMGLGTNNHEAIELISSLPNLYGDTAWVPIESTLRLIQRCGAKKVLFGTDSPIDGPDTYWVNREGHPSLYRQYFYQLKELLSVCDYENLMFRNAIRLFQLPFDV